jgi:RimJ/RimL family protein N-acetyltransferase
MEIQLEAGDPRLAELFLEYRQDPVTRRFNPLKESTLEELRERLATSSSDWTHFPQADSFFWFASNGAQTVGTASLTVNRMMLTAEIGYGVFANARGKGVGLAIVRTLIEQAFSRSPLRKLIAFVHEQNQASIRILEKAGFSCEGLLKEHYLIEGQPANERVFGLLRSDWHLGD